MTETVQPSELTPERITQIRTRYRMSRDLFAQLCGFTSASRVKTIETGGRLSPDDLDKVTAAANRLLTCRPPDSRKNGETLRDFLDRISGQPNEPYEQIPGQQELPTDDPVPDDTDDDHDVPESKVDVPISLSWCHEDDGDDDIIVLPERITLADLVAPPVTLDEEPFIRLSNSEIMDWLRCNRQWWFHDYLCYTPKTKLASAANTGNRIHRALACYYVPPTMPSLDPRDAIDMVIADDRAVFAADPEEHTEKQHLELEKSFRQERMLVDGYMTHLAETGVDDGLVFTEPEQELTAPLDVMVDGTVYRVHLIAKVDASGIDLRNDTGFFMDHKVTAKMEAKKRFASLSSQMLHYWLMRELLAGVDDRPTRVAYLNMINRNWHTDRVKPETNLYERYPVMRNRYELNAYRVRVVAVAERIIRARLALDAGADPLAVCPPTPLEDRCTWDCDFAKVCPTADGDPSLRALLDFTYERVDPLARYTQTSGSQITTVTQPAGAAGPNFTGGRM